MISAQTSALATHLSNNSSPIQYPTDRIDWQALHHQQFWLPESMLSLFGCAEYEILTKAQKVKLSHIELLHFIEFGLWLENLFITRLRDAIDVKDDSPSNLYNLHIIREETEHSLIFLQFFERSGYRRVHINKSKLSLYEKLWSNTSVTSSLFWAFVLAGEEIPLRMNKTMLKERHNITKTVADIVKLHSIDESRHVSHASAMLADTLQASGQISKQLIRLFAPRLIKNFTDVFYYPSQDVYVMAGLNMYTDWVKVARRNQARQLFVTKQVDNILRPLRACGIF